MTNWKENSDGNKNIFRDLNLCNHCSKDKSFFIKLFCFFYFYNKSPGIWTRREAFKHLEQIIFVDFVVLFFKSHIKISPGTFFKLLLHAFFFYRKTSISLPLSQFNVFISLAFNMLHPDSLCYKEVTGDCRISLSLQFFHCIIG